jgi:hypothetical protein
MRPKGYYKGKILAYGVRATKKGDPALTIAFDVEHQDAHHKVFFQSTWTGGGVKITNETLLLLGFCEPKRLPELALGVASGLLNTDDYYDLTIDIDQNAETKKDYNVVKFINDDSRNNISVEEFATLAGQRELIAQFIQLAEQKGIKTGSASKAIDIPF